MQDSAKAYLERIAERLELLRDDNETNTALGARLGVSTSAIGNYLKARSDIYLSTLVTIADRAGVSVPWLLGITDLRTADALRAAAAESLGESGSRRSDAGTGRPPG